MEDQAENTGHEYSSFREFYRGDSGQAYICVVFKPLTDSGIDCHLTQG